MLPKTALLIIDVQNDFLEGGALAVPHGNEVIPVITQLLKDYAFDTLVATQDWHPSDHISFARNHPGHAEYEELEAVYKPEKGAPITYTQRLWPVHCIQGSHGAALHSDIARLPIVQVVRKGYHAELDSYSAFADCLNQEKTGLEDFFRGRDIQRVLCVGLAEDYCVFETALAAALCKFETIVLKEGVRGINSIPADKQNSLETAGARYTNLMELPNILKDDPVAEIWQG